MKTSPLAGFFGLLMLLMGGVVLFYDGSLFAMVKASGLGSWYSQASSVLSPHHLWMSPAIGWFVLGTGAVLMGIKLHERKLI